MHEEIGVSAYILLPSLLADFKNLKERERPVSNLHVVEVIVTSARRYYDQACLLVGSFIHSFLVGYILCLFVCLFVSMCWGPNISKTVRNKGSVPMDH